MMAERIEKCDDLGDFLVGQGLMAGDGEFFGVDALSDGKFKRAPFLIAFLFVRRNGIVNLGLYAVVCEILLEFVATGAEYGEDMVDRIAQGLWYPNDWIVYIINIYIGNLLAALVVSIQMRELCQEDGGLDFIDT